MSTIVAKSRNFSYNEIRELENTEKEINICVVMVHPNGETRRVLTNESVFRDMIESDDFEGDTIIYDNK